MLITACASSISASCDLSSFTHGQYCTCSGLCVHTQQAGLLQHPVYWLLCQSADAVAVCSASSCLSCTRAAWPYSSLSSHAQLVTLAELSTASHIQAALAYKCLQGWAPVYLSRLCVPTASVSGRSQLRSADENQLLVPRMQTVTLGPRALSMSGPDAWNTLSSELRHSSVSLDCFRHSLKTSVQFVD